MFLKQIIVFVCLFVIPITKPNTIPTPFFTAQLPNVKAYGYYIPQPTDELVTQKGKEYFDASYQLLPQVLEIARAEQCPFVLMVPEQLTGFTTTSFHAPIIEGARVALTWASAYYRFKKLGNVDLRIVLLPSQMQDQNFVLNALINAMTFTTDIKSGQTPEELIKQRIMRATNFSTAPKQLYVTIEPYYPQQHTTEQTLITPSLPYDPSKKRIVITGAAGFLGSYLSEKLLEKGYQIIALDNLSCCTGKNIAHLTNEPHFSFHQYDVSYPFEITGPVDTVMHLASVPSPVQYYAMPIETLRSGLHGTKETLDLARNKNAKYIFASTSEVYGDPKEHPQSESYAGNVNPIGKRSQYDESKRGAETLIKLYFEQHNMDVRIARIFNTFGPGMQLSDGRVITNFIQAALTNQPMIIHGSGNQTRSPAYVSDTIEGIISVLESEKIGTFSSIEQRIFNVGTPEEFSINEIANLVNQLAEKYLHRTVPIKHVPHFDHTDPQVRKPDITYLNAITSFNTRVPFIMGLEKTFLHYYHQLARESIYGKE